MQTDGEPVREIVRQKDTDIPNIQPQGRASSSFRQSLIGRRKRMPVLPSVSADGQAFSISRHSRCRRTDRQKKHSASIFTSLIQDSSHKTSLTAPPPSGEQIPPSFPERGQQTMRLEENREDDAQLRRRAQRAGRDRPCPTGRCGMSKHCPAT